MLNKEKLYNTDDDPIILEHLGKYRSLMPSLALIFHLIEIADGISKGQVSEECAIQSIVCCEYLESHARRIYGMVTNSGELHGIKLSEKIQEEKVKNPFTLRDVYRNKWHLLKDKESVEKAVEYLIDKDWIREAKPENVTQKGRPTIQYDINPKIKKKSDMH